MDQVKSQVALVKLLKEKALHNLSLMIISCALQLSIGCGYGYRILGISLARNYLMSGAEPLVRCYAETNTKKDLEVLIETGSKFVLS